MRKLGTVLIAVTGLWVLAISLSLLTLPTSMLLSGFGEDEPGFALAFAMNMLPGIVCFVLGVILMTRSARLADSLFDDEALDIPVDGPMLLRVGLALFGVTLVARALPQLISTAWLVLRVSGAIPGLAQDSGGFAPPDYMEGVVSSVVTLVIGTALIRYSEPLSRRMWPRARLGTPAVDDGLLHCPACGESFDAADYSEDAPAPSCVRCGEPLFPDRA